MRIIQFLRKFLLRNRSDSIESVDYVEPSSFTSADYIEPSSFVSYACRDISGSDTISCVNAEIDLPEMGTRFGYYFLAHGFGSYDRSQFTPDDFVMKSITETLLDAPIENLARRYSQLSEKECEGAIRVAFQEASKALNVVAAETALVTITGALIRGKSIVFGHAGANRLFWIDRHSIQRLTRDHLFWPQMKLYSALGMLNVGTLTIDVSTYKDIGDGYLLLCTRRLWESISEGSIRDAVMTSTTLENACTRLLTSARNLLDHKSMAMIIVSNTNYKPFTDDLYA